MPSVLQDWVMQLPLRAQGTLLTGIRGCDTAEKRPYNYNTPERRLTAFLRYCVCIPADPRETDKPGAFFQSFMPTDWKASELGHLPQHWYSHILHCYEVVAYCCPNAELHNQAYEIYIRLVKNLHLSPELPNVMHKRLTEDRIANDTVVS